MYCSWEDTALIRAYPEQPATAFDAPLCRLGLFLIARSRKTRGSSEGFHRTCLRNVTWLEGKREARAKDIQNGHADRRVRKSVEGQMNPLTAPRGLI